MRNRERVLRSGGRLSTWLLQRDSAASCHLNRSLAETTHQTMSPRPLLSCSCWPLRPSSCLHTFLLYLNSALMVSLHRMREITAEFRFLPRRRRVCVASRARSHASAVAVSSFTVAGVWFGGGGRRDGDGKQGRHVLAAQSNGRVWVPRAGPCRRQSQRDVIAMERAGADALSPRCTRIIVGSGRRHRCNSHGC